MSSDPFGEGGQGGFVAGLVARLRPAEAAAAATPSPRSRHFRTESEELDDHMAGSEYNPADVCPRCGYARMSSVYCSVSATHHGTDRPLNTPRREKRGILQRIQDLIGTDRPNSDDDDDDDDAAVQVDAQTCENDASPASHADNLHESSSTPTPQGGVSPRPAAASSSWSLFKSKEAKQLDDVREEEERARRSIQEQCLNELRITEVNVREYSKKVRGDQKAFKQDRRDLEMACKTAFDVIYKERKEQLEVLQRIYTAELKRTKSAEKSTKKAKDAPLTEASPQSADEKSVE
jgi:hypothetical protein